MNRFVFQLFHIGLTLKHTFILNDSLFSHLLNELSILIWMKCCFCVYFLYSIFCVVEKFIGMKLNLSRCSFRPYSFSSNDSIVNISTFFCCYCLLCFHMKSMFRFKFFLKIIFVFPQYVCSLIQNLIYLLC